MAAAQAPSSSSSSERAFAHLASDPFLAPFFDQSFNPEAYVRSIVRQVRGRPGAWPFGSFV
jgi:hypothetical protein